MWAPPPPPQKARLNVNQWTKENLYPPASPPPQKKKKKSKAPWKNHSYTIDKQAASIEKNNKDSTKCLEARYYWYIKGMGAKITKVQVMAITLVIFNMNPVMGNWMSNS